MICARCHRAEAVVRAVSDVMDMPVCESCRKAAYEIPAVPGNLGRFVFKELPEGGCAG